MGNFTDKHGHILQGMRNKSRQEKIQYDLGPDLGSTDSVPLPNGPLKE